MIGTAKIEDLGGRRKRLTITASDPNALNAADMSSILEETGIDWTLDLDNYRIRIGKSDGVVEYAGKKSNRSFRATCAGSVERRGNTWTWIVNESTRGVLSCNRKGIEIYTIVTAPMEAPEDAWTYDGLDFEPSGMDADGDRLEFIDGRWTGRVSKVKDKTTRMRGWSTDARYPIRLM